jgi:uncharacterized protein (DUF4213/DUF364 family)
LGWVGVEVIGGDTTGEVVAGKRNGLSLVKATGSVMKILEDLLSVLNTEVNVRDIRQGLFHTAVLTQNCGLAATLPRDALSQEQPSIKEPGLLLNKSALELARMAYSQSILEAAIGMATINSLLEIDDECCQRLNARDLITEEGRGKKIAIVGHFPFIPEIRGVVKELWVIEKNPREGDFTEAEAEDFIPEADVVGITGTAFTNHTIEQLLELCHHEAYVVVLGDTTPLSPVLFDYGVDAISGTKVVDPDLALRCVSQGATYRQIKGIQQLTMTRDRKQVY